MACGVLILEGPGDIGYVASLAQRYTYDLAKAKSLLATAGYSHGFTVTANCSPQLDMAQLGEAVKSDWAKIGVNLQVSAPIQSVWVSQLLSGTFDFTGIGDYESNAYVQTKGSYLPGLKTGIYQIPGLAALFQAASAAPVGSSQATAAWAHLQQVEMNARDVDRAGLAEPDYLLHEERDRHFIQPGESGSGSSRLASWVTRRPGRAILRRAEDVDEILDSQTKEIQ